jgi:hypothetical protein
MSDIPTPETDALDCELHNPRVLSDRYSEMMEHAQKLERELDKVRHKLELCMAANSDVARIAKERDEAREQNAKLREIAEMAIEKIEQENRGIRQVSESWKQIRSELDQIKEEAK